MVQKGVIRPIVITIIRPSHIVIIMAKSVDWYSRLTIPISVICYGRKKKVLYNVNCLWWKTLYLVQCTYIGRKNFTLLWTYYIRLEANLQKLWKFSPRNDLHNTVYYAKPVKLGRPSASIILIMWGSIYFLWRSLGNIWDYYGDIFNYHNPFTVAVMKEWPYTTKSASVIVITKRQWTFPCIS